MRRLPVVLALGAVAACSEKSAEQAKSYDLQAPSPMMVAQDEAPSEAVENPRINPTAAPGVAFSYRYAFRLPADRIGAVQERHAQACEKLGVDRCRITGMRYRLVGERDIAAMLAFKLSPELARQFGKDGIAAVTEAEGMLVDSEVSGDDAGSAITAARRAEGRLRDERGRLEARLKQGGIGIAERENLNDRLEDIARQLAASQAGRDENTESLATTPMVFDYGSGELVAGFDGRSSIAKAFETAGALVVGGIATMIVVAGALVPLLILAILGLMIWWIAGPRIAKWRNTREAVAAATT